jgi:hypothetical protein
MRLKKAPHRHFVFSILKVLHRHFLCDRKLLLGLSLCTRKSLKVFLQGINPEILSFKVRIPLLPDRERPTMVKVIQPIRWN